MPGGVHRQRLENALEGSAEQPPVAGITFIPPEALSSLIAVDSGDPAEVIATAVHDLDLDFAFVPCDADWASDAVARLQVLGHAAVWVVDGPLWPVLMAKGLGDGLRTTAWEPESLDDDLTKETSRAQEEVLAGATLGVDAVVISDDLAGSTGPLVSPDYANEHLVERYALLVATAASAGLRAVFHSDGDTRAFMPGIARAGFIGVHGGGGLEGEVFERLLQCSRGQGLALLGGLDTGLIREGPAAAAQAGTHAAVLAGAGGLILADDGGITSGEEVGYLATALKSAGVGR